MSIGHRLGAIAAAAVIAATGCTATLADFGPQGGLDAEVVPATLVGDRCTPPHVTVGAADGVDPATVADTVIVVTTPAGVESGPVGPSVGVYWIDTPGVFTASVEGGGTLVVGAWDGTCDG